MAGQHQGIGQPHQGREGGTQIVGEGPQEGVAQAFRLHLQLGFLGHLDVMHPFQGDGHQGGSGFQQLLLFRGFLPGAGSHRQGQDAPEAHR